MNRYLVLSALLASAGVAQAQNTVELTDLRASLAGTNAHGEKIHTLTGRCGAALLKIEGATHDPDIGYDFDSQSSLTATVGKRALRSGTDFELDEHNEIACLTTPKGPRLVVAAWCGGTSCPPVQYQIVDAIGGKMLTKADWDRPCDKACAERALGEAPPKGLLAF